MKKSIVLDTNIVLDLFVFDDLVSATLKADLQAGQWHWIATAAMRDELARVLTYPHIVSRLVYYQRSVEAVLAQFDALAALVDAAPKAALTCKDGDDQKFIDLAVQHQAQLLSKDNAVLCMRKRLALLGVAAQPALD